jgi:hypothetical protein
VWFIYLSVWLLSFGGGYLLAKGIRTRKVGTLILSIVMIICATSLNYGVLQLQQLL